MKSNTDAFLTIAIPTYNRPDKVKNQVLSIIPQMNTEVKLIIIDNHSDIEISTLFSEYAIPENVKFVRNKFNIGADANIAKCFELCDTPWLWTLSDDDSLADNAVEIVLNDIKSKQDCLFINYNRKKSLEIRGLDDFSINAVDMYSYLFWMSVCVYNINLLSPYMQFYYQAISTMQPGVSLLIKSLAHNADSKIYLSGNKIIVGGGKGIGWNRENFLYATLYIFDYLRDESSALNRTVFKKIFSMCLMNIGLIYSHDRRFMRALRLFNIVLKRRGLINSLWYNCVDTISFVNHLFFYAITGRRMDTGDEKNC